jgi:hypothetical protein
MSDQCACRCGWRGSIDDADEVRDFWSRVSPGDEMPAGDCPECDELVYVLPATPGWDAHQGLDYTVVMRPGEGTDNASIQIATGDRELDAQLAEKIAAFFNAAGLNSFEPVAPSPSRISKLWVAAVDHRHGTNLYAAATASALDAQLADYCRTSWSERFNRPKDPSHVGLTDEAIVTTYFENHPDEWRVVADVDVAQTEPEDSA